MSLPIFSQDEIIKALRTSWTGQDKDGHDRLGGYEQWVVPHDSTGTVYYSIPTFAPNDEDNDPTKGESNGFDGAMMTSYKRDMARQAFELWDDLIAPNLTETSVTATGGNIITMAYSSTTALGNGTYTSAFVTGTYPD